MTKNDKRGTPRFQAKSGQHIIYLEGSGAIRDLSVNGMYVLDQDPLPDGTKITFALRLGTFDIQMKGIVVRSEEDRGMVIEFIDLTRETIRRLKIHLAELGPPISEPKKP